MPAVPPYIIEPIWEQLVALLPDRETDHPLGCHRPRFSDRLVFEKVVQVLVFGCAYEKIAEKGCSATTLRRCRERVDRPRAGGDLATQGTGGVRSRHRPGDLGVGRGLLHPEGALRGREASLREKAAAVREKVLREAEADFIGQGTEIFAARGLYDEAELYGRRALQLRRSVAADKDLGVADAELALGRLLSLLERDAEAAGHLEEALRPRDAILGPDDPATRLVGECPAYSRGRGG